MVTPQLREYGEIYWYPRFFCNPMFIKNIENSASQKKVNEGVISPTDFIKHKDI